jgi:hypothetical protein
MRKIVCLLFFVCLPAFGQRADFFGEDITFRLDGFYLDVEGYYWFSNHSGKPIHSNIFYPFPNYSGEKIDSIRLYNLSAGWEPEFKREGEYGISFDLFIAPLDTVLFQVGYRQKLNGDSAVYILKTTQGWGKPIDHAEFKLIAPDSLIMKKFSYPPDKSYLIEKKKIYIWKMKNFMPVRDMIFYF